MNLKKFHRLFAQFNDAFFSIRYSSKKRIRSSLTVLKSPHVNKTAQEQFEFRFYRKFFQISSYRSFVLLFVFKKFEGSCSSFVKALKKIYLNIPNNRFERLNPDNFTLDVCFHDSRKILELKTFVVLFDCYGEFLNKQFIRESNYNIY